MQRGCIPLRREAQAKADQPFGAFPFALFVFFLMCPDQYKQSSSVADNRRLAGTSSAFSVSKGLPLGSCTSSAPLSLSLALQPSGTRTRPRDNRDDKKPIGGGNNSRSRRASFLLTRHTLDRSNGRRELGRRCRCAPTATRRLLYLLPRQNAKERECVCEREKEGEKGKQVMGVSSRIFPSSARFSLPSRPLPLGLSGCVPSVGAAL